MKFKREGASAPSLCTLPPLLPQERGIKGVRSESLYNTVFIYYFESALKQIELRFAHFQPPTNYASTRYLAPWAKKVEEATGGKVKVTVYAGGTLAKETETLTAVQFGVADIGLLVDAYAKGSFPLGEVNSLPFILLTVQFSSFNCPVFNFF